jgi:hypothetical protein
MRLTMSRAAVLITMFREPQKIWTIKALADEANLQPSYARVLLKKFHDSSLVSMIWYDNANKKNGEAHINYQLTDYGQERAAQIAKLLKDPAEAVSIWSHSEMVRESRATVSKPRGAR